MIKKYFENGAKIDMISMLETKIKVLEETSQKEYDLLCDKIEENTDKRYCSDCANNLARMFYEKRVYNHALEMLKGGRLPDDNTKKESENTKRDALILIELNKNAKKDEDGFVERGKYVYDATKLMVEKDSKEAKFNFKKALCGLDLWDLL